MADDIIKGVQVNSAGFGTISKLAMQDRRLHIAAKAIYAYFNSYAGGGDTCFPSRKKICFDLGISNDTLSKYLRQLTECGYISVEQIKEGGRFSHNIYTLNGTVSPCPKISDTENVGNGKTDTNINSLNINSISNTNRKERKKAASSFDEIIAGYTSSEELKQALYEYIKMRKLMKKPLTDYALKRQLSTLDRLASTDTEKVAVVDQSVTRGWLGLFEIKQDYNKNSNKPAAQQPKQETEEERLRREQNEKLLALIEGGAQ